MSLRTLIDDAIYQLNTYKHANIDEALEYLDKILDAAEQGSIKHDHIESIEVDDKYVTIETTWSVRCCTNQSTYKFPTYILDAKDPLKEAKKWNALEMLQKAKSRVLSLKKELEHSEKSLLAAEEQYNSLLSN